MNRARWCFVAGGAALAVFALALDYVVPGTGQPNIGPKQWLLFGVGVGIMIGSKFLSDRMFRRGILIPTTLFSSTYLSLFAAEIVLRAVQPPIQQSGFVRGMYTPDPVRGYRLTSSFQGVDDDGYVHVTYKTNSRGDRDEELASPKGEAMLLIGDSFTFGLRLNEGEPIDKQIESITHGKTRAYNLGVPGYGPPAIRQNLELNDWFTGGEIVYLFCNNDLSSGDLAQPLRTTAFDGYIVPKFKDDGSTFSTTEYAEFLHNRLQPSIFKKLASAIRLTQVKELIGSRLKNTAMQFEHPAENVEQALGEILAMSRLASSRGCSFRVALIPCLYELTHQPYASSTLSLIAKLRSSGIAILDLAQHLKPEDFFLEEGHFNASGARRAAEALLMK